LKVFKTCCILFHHVNAIVCGWLAAVAVLRGYAVHRNQTRGEYGDC